MRARIIVTMAYIPRSSLIPTETSGAIPVQMKRKRTIHAFGLIATIVFILSLLGAVGVFLYKDYLGSKLEEAKKGFDATSNDETERSMAEIRRYDDKLRIAEQLLNNHVAASRIFEKLEDFTKQTVRFSSFEFIHDPGFESAVTLRGETGRFSSVALQKMQIFQEGPFEDFVLQNITTSDAEQKEDGTVVPAQVTFSVNGVFKDDAISYKGGAEENEEATEESVLPIVPIVVPTEASEATAPSEIICSGIPVVIPPTP